jgi:hypothetical protein
VTSIIHDDFRKSSKPMPVKQYSDSPQKQSVFEVVLLSMFWRLVNNPG